MKVNEEFFTNPPTDPPTYTKESVLAFFKKYPVSTANMSGSRPEVSKILEGETTGLVFTGKGADEGIKSGVFQATKEYFDFDRNNRGEVVIQKSVTEDAIPAYCLPWGGMFVMSMQIPAEAECNFFFTAALSGCSVFAGGDPASPTVYHAGTEGKYKEGKDPSNFWRFSIELTAKGSGIDLETLSGINKKNYLGDTNRQAFKAFLESNVKKSFKIENLASAGFVFGFKNEGRWEFYLQERVTCTTHEFVKIVPKRGYVSHPLTARERELIGGVVGKPKKETETVHYRNPFKRSKKVEISCNIERQQTHPVSLRQFFPTGSFNVNLIDQWRPR